MIKTASLDAEFVGPTDFLGLDQTVTLGDFKFSQRDLATNVNGFRIDDSIPFVLKADSGISVSLLGTSQTGVRLMILLRDQ